MGIWGSFFSNLKDAFAAGGDREAFHARRGARLQATGRDENWNRFVAALGRSAREGYERAIAEGMTGAGEVQYVDEEVKVKVRNGYSRDHKSWTTDVVVSPRKNNTRGSHLHVVYDEYGREIYNQWREN